MSNNAIESKMLGDVFGKGQATRPAPSGSPSGRVIQVSEKAKLIKENTDEFLRRALIAIENEDWWIDYALALKAGAAALPPDMSVTGWTEISSHGGWRTFRPTADLTDTYKTILRIVPGCAIQTSVNSKTSLAQIKTRDGNRYTLRGGGFLQATMLRALGKVLNNSPDKE